MMEIGPVRVDIQAGMGFQRFFKPIPGLVAQYRIAFMPVIIVFHPMIIICFFSLFHPGDVNFTLLSGVFSRERDGVRFVI
ncbi:hypothetical protein [Acerihabitans arboris]|uniref:Uncharacterized protein n=1 Tax=Acerihabitans arboris TaxID=2691583 RepID=A0A845SNZ9_9GAMM|nr:hypothetical protein [Acerihabitans arboris]NDL64654.1 hypothetical protein [Acerihabitans arboris]